MTDTGGAAEPGIIDAANGILRELLRTPGFKDTALIVLRSVDPHAARELVRTALWTDPVLFMSFFGAMPHIVNAMLEAAAEVVNQAGSLPVPLLRDFIKRVADEIDGGAAGEAAAGLVSFTLALGLGEDGAARDSLRSLAEEFTKAYRETRGVPETGELLDRWMSAVTERARDESSTTHYVIHEVAEAIGRNRDFAEHVIGPVLSRALELHQGGDAPADVNDGAADAGGAISEKEPGTGGRRPS